MGLIAGIYGENISPDQQNALMKMMECQSHRGKGAEVATFFGENVALGMMNAQNTTFCGPGSKPANPAAENAFVDGIVLDVPKLIDSFERCGHPLSSSTCSAAISAAYKKWGLDFMLHLEGEFSCALWDEVEQRLILARDAFGHKPLHYYHGKDTFYFSSEIKGLLAAGIPAELDLVSFSDYLTLNCVPYPATIFKNVYQVPPGGMLIVDRDGIRVKTWWEPKAVVDHSITFEDAAAALSSVFKRSVQKRLLGDETFCFLSGGIDSSAIVSFAAEISGKKVHAISVGFEEEEENELHDAEIMARHVGAEFHPLIVKPDSFFAMLETLVFHHDSPFTDTSAYPTYFAAQAGAGIADVILTGDGPDQSLGGSSHYVFAVENDIFAPRPAGKRKALQLAARLLDQIVANPVPAFLSRMQRKLYRDSLPSIHAAYDLRSYFPDIVKKFICMEDVWQVHLSHNPYRHPEKWFSEAKGYDDINKYLYADMKFYLPDDLMIKVDRMCMAHGLETLSPFLDREFSGLVNQLPGAFKIKNQDGLISTKHILKEICAKRFPPAIVNKKKQGFGIPLEKWLKQDNGKMVREILLDPASLQRPYFKKNAIVNVVQTFLSGQGDYFYPSSNCIASLLTFELWHRRYLDA